MTQSNMLIMSIDPSLNGSCIILGNDEYILDYIYFSPLKSDANNKHCNYIPKEFSSEVKLDTFIQYLNKLFQIENIQLLVLESPAYCSKNTNDSFKSMYALIQYFARQNNIKYLLVPPISNKLFFTGNSKADKKEVIKNAKNIYKKYVDFDNISSKHQEDVADALALFNIGVEYVKQGVNNNLPLHQQQVLAKLKGDDKLYKDIVKQRTQKKR